MAERFAASDKQVQSQTTDRVDTPQYLSRADIDKFAALLNGSKEAKTATNDGQNVLPSMELTGDQTFSKCGKPKDEKLYVKCGLTRPEHERHALQPNDGKLIGKLVEEQTDEHGLTPKGEKALKEALSLVANSNTQDGLDKLAKFLPELMTCDGGKVKAAFEESLQELGYKTKMESHLPEEKRLFAPRHYRVSIQEPGQSIFGGKMIAIEFKNAGGATAEDEISVSKYAIRG